MHIMRLFRRTPRMPEAAVSGLFPDQPETARAVRERVHDIADKLAKRNLSRSLGALYTLPHPAAVAAYTALLAQNPGNLGNWSGDTPSTEPVKRLEHDVISKMINLYHGERRNLRGYITSGGTEGNIFLMWLGRTRLNKQRSGQPVCLLRTDLTHYSVEKSGRITNIPRHTVPLDPKTWAMSMTGFSDSVQTLYRKGYRGFLVPLTLGYPLTGTCDPIDAILSTARALRRELGGIKFFFWIDAATNGYIAPFLDPSFSPFEDPAIQAIIVDIHKFGLVPYPAGILLYKKTLHVLVDKPIHYLAEHDATLLGSRSGLPAASIWTMIHTLGKRGYRQILQDQMGNKKYFMKIVHDQMPDIEIITDPQSLHLGIIYHKRKNQRLPQWMETKYNLYPGKTALTFQGEGRRSVTIYKIFFLPHLKKSVLDEFFSDLLRLSFKT